VLSPEEEREFWSAVGANDVSREKLTRVLDRSFHFLNLVFFKFFVICFSKGDFWDF
jgi:hypothetical protein